MLTGLGVFIGLEYLQHVARSAGIFAGPMYAFYGWHRVAPSPQTVAIANSWCIWGNLLTEWLWIPAGPVLAGFAWRKRESLASGSAVDYDLQPGEQQAARALQSQGLSLDEAGLVLAHRRCSQEAVALSLADGSGRGIWLERAAWMVTGVALTRCLEWLVLAPALIVSAASRPAAPLSQHLASFASLCLGLAVAAVIITGLWRWVTRYPNQRAFIARVCRLRPVFASVALVLVCAAIWCCSYTLLVHVVRPTNRSMGLIVREWRLCQTALTRLIIPIALLLWLARRWWNMQTSPAPCR